MNFKEIFIIMILIISVMLWDLLSRLFVYFNHWLIILWFLMTPFAIIGMILSIEWLQEKLKIK